MVEQEEETEGDKVKKWREKRNGGKKKEMEEKGVV